MNTARAFASAFAFLSLSAFASVAAAGTAPGSALQGHEHAGVEGSVAFIAAPAPMMAVDANLQRMGLAAAPAAAEQERPNRADCQILGECSPTARSRDLD